MPLICKLVIAAVAVSLAFNVLNFLKIKKIEKANNRLRMR